MDIFLLISLFQTFFYNYLFIFIQRPLQDKSDSTSSREKSTPIKKYSPRKSFVSPLKISYDLTTEEGLKKAIESKKKELEGLNKKEKELKDKVS